MLEEYYFQIANQVCVDTHDGVGYADARTHDEDVRNVAQQM